MTAALAAAICIILSILALWHVYWAFGGMLGKAAAIPELNGAPTISPSPAGTLAVAVALFVAESLVAAVGGLVTVAWSPDLLFWCARGLACLFLLRAIGDFRVLGFFKRVRGTRFATLDTLVYAPLCLALSAGIFVLTDFLAYLICFFGPNVLYCPCSFFIVLHSIGFRAYPGYVSL